ncbi:hypothetical protein ACLOJK_023015 [Asimina triloba]
MAWIDRPRFDFGYALLLWIAGWFGWAYFSVCWAPILRAPGDRAAGTTVGCCCLNDLIEIAICLMLKELDMIWVGCHGDDGRRRLLAWPRFESATTRDGSSCLMPMDSAGADLPGMVLDREYATGGLIEWCVTEICITPCWRAAVIWPPLLDVHDFEMKLPWRFRTVVGLWPPMDAADLSVRFLHGPTLL